MIRVLTIVAASGLLALAAQGCGTQAHSTTQPSGVSGATGASAPGAGALSAEATSAATGDIPDTQVFLTYRNQSAGYSMSYPEGWTQRGAGRDITISDKNNIVHIVVDKAGAPNAAAMTAELTRLKQGNPTLTFTTPTTIRLSAGSATKATYRTRSAPNPVTGKSVELIVDRYELVGAGKRVTVDLGTPTGVDNVDAYRKMINSFRWQ